MMDALINWSLRNRLVVLAAAVILTAIGIRTTARMPIDVFPDLTAPTVTVITEAHGMAPAELENQVTFLIETALNGASGVRRVRSATAVGISIVWAEFDWGTDILAARQIVSEKIALVTSDLPAEVERPILAPISSVMGEILFIALTSDSHSPIDLRNTAETAIRRRLLAIPGVAQVTPIGGAQKQYQAVIAAGSLQAFGVTLNETVRALEEANENVSAGIINERGGEWLVTGTGRLRSVEDIAATAVAARDGVPVLVGDLGEVRVGAAPKRGEGSANGKYAVVLGVQKQPDANTLDLTRRIELVLSDVEKQLPEGMQLHTGLFRQADFIEVAVANLRHALRDGAILVVIIILVFLANARASLITLTAIPLSLLAAVLALRWLGASINTMTLGGMAIAIGALVDDAVIDVENVFRRLRENAALPEEKRRSIWRVVHDASVEIRSSIVFATLIIVLVFVPVFFLGGVEGRLLHPLGIAYIVALLSSLVVAVTVTPVLCYYLLPGSRAVLAGTEPKLVHWLKARYALVLRPTLRHPWLAALPAVALLVGALIATAFMGRSFLPEFNEGSLTINGVTLPGTSLAQSDALGRLAEETLLRHFEVAAVARRTGRAELDEHAMGVESSEFEVTLKMQGRSKAAFLEKLRHDLSLVPGLQFTIGQPISHRIDHMLSGTRANIAVKIFGPDLYRLRALADKARGEMEAVRGVVDLSVEPQIEVPLLRVKFNRQALARHGVSIREASRALEAAVQGTRATRILEGQNIFDVMVRLQAPEEPGADNRSREEDIRWRLDTIGRLLVDTPSGARVPLLELAEIIKDTGPNVINREQVERKIVVMCNVADRDVVSVVREIQDRVSPLLEGAPGYHVEYGGRFESAIEAGRILAVVGAAVIVGIGLLLYMAFRSMRDALLVMVNLPLALIGGVAGVFLSGGVLSVASLIGFITVFGIATRNGIMLVSHIRNLQSQEGVTDFNEAVFRGSMERLAPILMTALGTALALIPLALGGDKPGSEIQTPMAMVILFGLLTSMFLNMLVVPALYLRFGRPAKIETGGER